jgi:diguanylate cyclase (GGDEF)-like protein/PAS domain S-box-containing protein
MSARPSGDDPAPGEDRYSDAKRLRNEEEPLSRFRREDPEIFRLAVEISPAPTVVVREDGTILMANRAAEALFGYKAPDLVGRPVELLLPSGLRPRHRQHRQDYLNQPETRPMGAMRDLEAITRDGSRVPVEVGLSPFQSPSGVMVICAVVDLRGRKETEAELADRAAHLAERNEELVDLVTTDSLTGLKNRRAFMDTLMTTVEVSVRNARSFSVLIVDLDHFKGFNDDFGHLEGDEVLKTVAGVLTRVARRSDLVARIGGEELGIILPETDADGASVLAERFRFAIEEVDWPRRPVTASIGATTVNFHRAVPRPEPPDLSTILTQADRALYRSKDRGRNCVTHARELAGE